MIVGEALLRDGNDMHAMPAVLQSMERTLSEFPSVVVADKGYDSGETHTELASRSILGVIVPQGKEASFWDVNDSGEPVCPKGFAPKQKGSYMRRGRRWVRFTVRECKGCALKSACGVKDFKTIYVPEGTNVADRILNARRFESEAIQALARTRGPTVELIFARLVLRYGLRRLSYKERSKAHAEFRMSCLAENLRILLRLLFGPFQSVKSLAVRAPGHKSKQRAPSRLICDRRYISMRQPLRVRAPYARSKTTGGAWRISSSSISK
jgi:hypothetical protein